MNNAIIQPLDFLRYASEDIFEELKNIRTALLCFDRGNYKMLKKTVPGRRIRGLSASGWLTENRVLICGNFGIGAPAAVDLLEQLNAAGICKIISFGTAGALNEELTAGELIVCSEAFPDEGTSRHYFPNPGIARPSGLLLNDTENFLSGKGIAYKTCKAWTTDAPFRETPEKLRQFTGLGFDVVEMEASAMYHVAAYRKVDLLALFVIGDSIARDTWKPSFDLDSVRNKLMEVSYTLIELLRS